MTNQNNKAKGEGVRFASIVFIVLMTLLMALPAGYDHRFVNNLFRAGLVQAFGYSVVMLVLSWNSVWLRRIFFTIAYILMIVETFLYIKFGSRLDPNMLTLMLQTSWNEIKEFTLVYMMSPYTMMFFAVSIIAYVACLKLICMDKMISTTRRGVHIIQCLVTIAAVVALAVQFVHLPESFTRYVAIPLGRTTVNELIMSIRFVTERHSETDRMAATIDKIKITRPVDTTFAPTLVFIIGESFNKNHSSLYGYSLPTSPLLDAELKRGNLICFDNAMSPTSGTDFAMRYLFTLRGCEHTDWTTDTADVHQYVLMPAVIRKAGGRVAYFDNQYTRSRGGMFDYSCSYFLNPPQIDSQCFDFRNDKLQTYDLDFIMYYKDEFFKRPADLNIIHLMGQHFDAKLRYPDTWEVLFTKEDIKRSDLSANECQKVAEYDNATLYNDCVVARIIDEFREIDAVVIYVSDHGEQIYDGQKRYFGRGFIDYDDAESINAIYNVPMMVWCSDRFITNHDETYQTIRQAVHQPVCTADLPYMLFSLEGIDFNFNKPDRSVIDKNYIPHQVRLNKK